MSWVFISGERVRKLKKPIRTTFLDFRTLAARESNSRIEVNLNRRLAPDVYLGACPLYVTCDGQLSLKQPGMIVDWIVSMRRLDEDRMLDRLIESDAVRMDEVNALATVFARFYTGLPAISMSSAVRLHGLSAQLRFDRSVLLHERSELSSSVVLSVCEAIEAIIKAPPEWLLLRTQDRRIVEGHGDLRLEHICLSQPPVVIDCLEFDRHLRLVDPFEELAGLRMECAQLDARWIGEHIIETCAQALHDSPHPALLAFHSALKACLRARLALQHLLRSPIAEPNHWMQKASDYLTLARLSVEELATLNELR